MSLLPRSPHLAACALLGLFAHGLSAQSLSTLFTSNNGGSSGWVVMFDATVTNPQGLRITGLDVNCAQGASHAITVDLWLTPLTSIGNERNAAVWIKVATGSTISGPRDTPTFVDISDVVLTPGSYGLAVQVTGGSGQAYTNGTGSNQSYSDANLSLQLGSALSTQFLTTGSFFTPRVWNGTIHYATPGTAAYGIYGEGCLGSNGTPALAPAAGSKPSIGQSLSLNMTGGPSTPTAATVALGFSKSTFSNLPLPLDLTPLGMTGCQLLLDPLLYTPAPMSGGAATYVLPIPNDPTLFGLALYHQGFVVDLPGNALGLIATNGGEGVIGN